MVKLQSGTTYGEMAFFEGGPRNADVITDTECVVAVVGNRGMQRINEIGGESAGTWWDAAARPHAKCLFSCLPVSHHHR